MGEDADRNGWLKSNRKGSKMALYMFGTFNIQRANPQSATGWNGTRTLDGLVSLFAALHRCHEGPIRVSSSELEEIEAPSADFPSEPDTWSVFTRFGSRWVMSCIGARSIDDASDTLIHVLQHHTEADEMRICPPGTPQPMRLS